MSKIISGQFHLKSAAIFAYWETLVSDISSDRIFLCMEKEWWKMVQFEDLKRDLIEYYFNKIDDFKTRELAFENAIKEINKKHSKDLKWSSVIIWLYSNMILYVTWCWDAESYLIRAGRLSLIVENADETGEKVEKGNEFLFENISNWDLLWNDIIIFSSRRLLRHFTAEQIASAYTWVSEWLDTVKEVFVKEELTWSVVSAHVQKHSVFAWVTKKEIKTRRFDFKPNINWDKIGDFSRGIVENISWFLARKSTFSYETIQKSVVALAWVVIIVILIIIIARASQNTQEKELYESNRIQILQIEQELFRAAEDRALMWSVSDANGILNSIEERANKILADWMFRDESMAILEKVQSRRDDINKVKRYKNVKDLLVLDLGDWIELKWMIPYNWWILAYSKNKFYRIVVNKLEKEIDFVPNENIANVVYMDVGNMIYVMTENKVLYEFNWEKFSKVITDDESWWKDYVNIASYNKYLYFLEPWRNVSTWEVAVWAKGRIWKYAKNRESFWRPSSYGQDIDFTNAQSLAIDWSIYVLYNEGRIINLYNGKETPFSYSWPAEMIKDVSKLYTNVDYLNIYLLDPVNSKIMVLGKAKDWAEFKRQYVFEKERINSFTINKDEQEMLVLWEHTLYKVWLK